MGGEGVKPIVKEKGNRGWAMHVNEWAPYAMHVIDVKITSRYLCFMYKPKKCDQ